MAADAVLNYTKSGILGHNNPCMGIIYLRTKFDANVFIAVVVMRSKIQIQDDCVERWMLPPS